MRRHRLLLVTSFLLVFGVLGFSQDAELYHMVRLTAPTESQILQLMLGGLPMEDGTMTKEGYIDIPLSESELGVVRSVGVAHEIIQENLSEFYARRYQRELERGLLLRERTDPVHFEYGSMGGFYTFQEIMMELDSMNILYPNICAPRDSIGAGWDGNTIWMLKISDNPLIDEDEPEVEYDALHHAREPGGYTALLYTMWWLLENYGIDAEATHLINNRELYFIPVANPDGLLYNQLISPGGGGMWRKNRRDNGSGVYGVDLNRNYAYQWGYDNYGSSPNPSSATYRGPAAFSEPETQAIRDLFNTHDFRTAMTVHTSGGHYLYAYGYDLVMPESLAVHQEYGAEVSRDNGYDYGTCRQILYSSNGRTQDWEHHEHMTVNIEPEIGFHGFWPSTVYIFPEARENQHCILWMAWCGGAKMGIQNITPLGGTYESGTVCSLMVSLKNQGMGDGLTGVTTTLLESSPYISLVNYVAEFDTFTAREINDNASDPFVFSIMPGAPEGYTVDMALQTQYEGYTQIDSFSIQIGTEIVVFEDDAESGTGNWNMSSWGMTTGYAYSPTHSFTDSPFGNYSNNQTNIMTMQGVVDLSDILFPMLKFWTRWEIEASWDFGQVEASMTGGASWFPLEGQYTSPGSGQGVQSPGQPGYDGFQTSWVEESMSLEDYAGIDNLKIRFELRSDGGVVEDGWYVDDIRVVGFQQGPPPEISDLIILWAADGAELIWTPIPGVDSYNIYHDTQPIFDVSTLLIDSTVSGPPYIDAGSLYVDRRFYVVTYDYSP